MCIRDRLIGCDVLRQHSAVIDLHKGTISLTSEEGLWTAELIDTNRTVPVNTRCLAIKSYFCKENKIPEVIQYEDDDPKLWQSKLEEIREFQREKTYGQISKIQAENLIQIYNKYKHVFSNAPGKVKGYQCVINFKEPVNFRRKSYPIAYSIKNEVRDEINRMIQDDIIEYSQSPYTSSIVAVSYTHLDVYKRQL